MKKTTTKSILFRRVTAIMMAFIMCASMFAVNVFAENSAEAAPEKQTEAEVQTFGTGAENSENLYEYCLLFGLYGDSSNIENCKGISLTDITFKVKYRIYTEKIENGETEKIITYDNVPDIVLSDYNSVNDYDCAPFIFTAKESIPGHPINVAVSYKLNVAEDATMSGTNISFKPYIFVPDPESEYTPLELEKYYSSYDGEDAKTFDFESPEIDGWIEMGANINCSVNKRVVTTMQKNKQTEKEVDTNANTSLFLYPEAVNGLNSYNFPDVTEIAVPVEGETKISFSIGEIRDNYGKVWYVDYSSSDERVPIDKDGMVTVSYDANAQEDYTVTFSANISSVFSPKKCSVKIKVIGYHLEFVNDITEITPPTDGNPKDYDVKAVNYSMPDIKPVYTIVLSTNNKFKDNRERRYANAKLTDGKIKISEDGVLTVSPSANGDNGKAYNITITAAFGDITISKDILISPFKYNVHFIDTKTGNEVETYHPYFNSQFGTPFIDRSYDNDKDTVCKHYSEWVGRDEYNPPVVPGYLTSSITINSDCPADLYYLAEYYEGPHDLKLEKVRKEQTCGQDGVNELKCAICGYTTTEILPATGKHDYYWEVRIEPNCAREGDSMQKCRVCGEWSYKEHRKIPKLPEHNFQFFERVAEATCTKDGTDIYKCPGCSHTETRTVPALGHDMKETDRKEATCKANGYIETKCERCGETETKVLVMLDHTEENGDGLCDVCGAELSPYYTYHCRMCDTFKEKKDIPVIGKIIYAIHYIVHFVEWITHTVR